MAIDTVGRADLVQVDPGRDSELRELPHGAGMREAYFLLRFQTGLSTLDPLI